MGLRRRCSLRLPGCRTLVFVRPGWHCLVFINLANTKERDVIMNWFKNVSVAKKVASLIAISVLFLLGVGFTGYSYLQTARNEIETMYKERLIPIQLINENRAHSRAVEADLLHLTIVTNDKEKQRLLADIESRAEDYNKNLATYEKTSLDTNEAKMLQEMKAILSKYREQRQAVIQLVMANKNAEAYQVFYSSVMPTADIYHSQIIQISNYLEKQAAEVAAQNEKDFAKAVMIMIGIIITAAILISFLGWIISRMITLPLQHVSVAVQEVAAGNLSIGELEVQSSDEVGKVAVGLNSMVKSLRVLISHVNNSAEQLAASSEELTASAEQTAIAAGQVAVSVSEVASGTERQLTAVHNGSDEIEHMLKGLQHVAANSNTVAARSDKAADAATTGSIAIKEAIAQITTVENTVTNSALVVEKLGEQSKEIDQIVSTISGIASQTNLLALNAAIEAARAGEQGRGFAVVADEVRKLAEQSQEAAKQIAKLIRAIQSETESAVTAMKNGKQEVRTGVNMVNNAGQVFDSILDLVKTSSNQVREISAEIDLVSQGSQSIVRAMDEIAAVSKESASETQTVSAATEEQSASMEEIASSSQALAALAEELRAAVSKFTV